MNGAPWSFAATAYGAGNRAQARVNGEGRHMTLELHYLVLVTTLTALLWVPYILNRIAVRGLAPTSRASRARAQCSPARCISGRGSRT